MTTEPDDRQPIRVLWVNHFAVPPSEAGGTRHFEMARGLARRGWRVTIAGSDFHLQKRAYTRRGDGDRAAVSELVGSVEFRWLYAAPYQKNDWRRLLNWITFARSLLRERWTVDPPRLVIGSSPHLLAAWAAWRVARTLGVPFVFEVRDLWPESLLAGRNRRGPTYWCLAAVANLLYRKADRVLVLARGSVDYLKARGVAERRLDYLPNGVETAGFGARQPNDGGGETFTLLYAGAHGPMNGLDAVLAAAAIVRADPRIRFKFVGDGPAKQSLMQDARRMDLSNVDFDDPVPKDQVPRLMAQVDAGLMVLKDAPLFAYGVSPNKLFDYLAAGLPVVCNVPGEVASMVASAGAGVQARDSTAAALVDAIRDLVGRSAADRDRMGRAGREWVEREHDRDRLAQRLDTVLRGVLG